MEQIDVYAVEYSVYATIRRTDRIVRQFYDQVLEPGGLLITQFTLLSSLMTVSPVTVLRLAEILGMDRTTLTRNLDVLTRQKLVHIEEGLDRRTRLVSVTKHGTERYQRALPYWHMAQAQFVEKLGEQRVQELLEILVHVETAVR